MTNTVNGAAVQQPTIKKKSRAGETWRRFRKNKLAVFGMILFALILLVAIFADAIVNYSVATTQVAVDRLQSPNTTHWFGTDNYGRDLFARIVHGSRNSLLVGFGSVAIGVVLGVGSQMVSMLVFGILWAVLITFVKHNSKMSADTIISVFSSTSIALGLVILARGGAFAKYSSYLVGDVLSVTAGDLAGLLVTLLITAAVWVMLFNPLLLTSVNAPLAQSRGVRAKLTEYAFTVIVAVAVMMSIRWVGVMLINSLLILPAAASRNVARNAAWYMRLSVLIALCCGVAGLVLSYYLNTSAGAAIVLCAAAVYFVTLPLRRK